MGKKIGIFCFQLLVLIAIYKLGNQTVTYLQIKIPGNVVGMIILFCLLWLKVIKIDQIQLAANWLLKHFAFFFIPISVGLMTLGPTIIQHGISILFVLSISAIIGLVTAGKATQSLIKKREEVKKKTHDHSI